MNSAIKKNALNITIFLSFLNITWMLLGSKGLVNIDNFSNTGIFSVINMCILLFGIAYTLWLGLIQFAGRRLDWLCLSFAFQIYFLREANFHLMFTEHSLTSWKSYTLPDDPVFVRVIGASLLLTLFLVMTYLLSRYSSSILKSIKRMHGWAISGLLWVITLASSRVLHWMASHDDAVWQYKAIEEMFELSAACFAIAGLIQFVNQYSNKYKDYFS